MGAACLRVSFFSSSPSSRRPWGTLAVQILLLALGGYMTFHGQITLGSLAAFQTLFINSREALAKITHFYPSLLQGPAAVRRIQEFLAEKPGVVDLPDARTLPRLSREIRFNGVKFGYTPAQLNLNNVSFTIRAGESVAFVGPSGAGKSTVLSILTRFYEPDAGAVTFDGDDAREVSQESLRAQLGMVFQESILFNTTIRENIRVGKAGASDADIEAAACAAEMHEIIMAMPGGYDTPVGERGGRLSGGERQRIAIARAILRGTLTVWVNMPDSGEKQIRTMDDGDYFGEIALMEDTTRTATVRTSTDCIFLTLARDPFLKLLQREPKLREGFQKVVIDRLQASTTILKPRSTLN